MNARALLVTPAGSPRAPWRLVFFAGALFVFAFTGTLLYFPIATALRVPFGSLTSLTIQTVIQVFATLGATWLALRWLDRKSWKEVGLARSSASPELVAGGFLLGGFAIAFPILLLILIGWLRFARVMLPPPGHPVISLTLMLLPAALAEELLTRGYLLTVLKDVWNWPVAVVITSVAFGLLHLANKGASVQSVALVTLAGVFLATVRIATGSLYAAWAAHFAWNWVMAVCFHAAVSGIAFDAPGYRYVDAGPVWATGGVWGPEGGVPAGLFMIAGIALLVARLRRRDKGGTIDE